MDNLLNRFITAISILLICVSVLSFFFFKNDIVNARDIDETDRLTGQRVGVISGWEADYLLSNRNDITLKRYNSAAELFMALSYKQIDAVAVDACTKMICDNSIQGLEIVGDPLDVSNYTLYVRKGNDKLLNDLNNFIVELKQSDYYDTFVEHFFDLDYVENGEYIKPTGTGEVFNVGYVAEYYPLEYATSEGEVRGCEVDFITLFANKMNYQIVYHPVTEENFEMDMKTGKIDTLICSASDLYRVETETEISIVTMTDGYIASNIYCIVSDGDLKILNGDAYDEISNY